MKNWWDNISVKNGKVILTDQDEYHTTELTSDEAELYAQRVKEAAHEARQKQY